jgi:two-component system response regulator DctR
MEGLRWTHRLMREHPFIFVFLWNDTGEGKMIRVLLIEDDPMVQEVNKQFIERVKGFKVMDKADNGKEGLQKIEDLKPDLVFLDVFMPTVDGAELLHQLRKKKIDVDVIVITAANDQDTIKHMLQHGAIDYIIKPFKFDRIKQALTNYVNFKKKLTIPGALTQEQLDEMLHGSETVMKGTGTVELPKGLNEATLTQISTFMKDQMNARSAEDVAEGVGIARVTARRYLEYLKNNGAIQLEIQYGGVGRPVNRYIIKR